MKGSDRSENRMWDPLGLGNPFEPGCPVKRQTVLDLIRSVYDPLIFAWIKSGGAWEKQFSVPHHKNIFIEEIQERLKELPLSCQSVNTPEKIALILFDLLRYLRSTMSIWQIPMAEIPPA